MLPLAIYLLPELQRIHLLGVPLPLWILIVPCSACSLAIGWLYARRADALDEAFRELVRATTMIALLAVGAVDARNARPRRLGRALRADDLGPAGRLAGGQRLVERGRDLRRVPVGRELPRDRGPEMQIGAAALWQSLGFTAGYLALLLFVAAPLRRFGSYTIPDFAEARLRSPRLRIAGRR